MRRASRVDANQAEIVTALRGVGCSVQPLHAVGEGVPDLLVGKNGTNFLVEVKDGAKPPSARQLTGPQREWHDAWRGNVAVVKNVAEALTLVGCGFRFSEGEHDSPSE
jgi:hypothetical protein